MLFNLPQSTSSSFLKLSRRVAGFIGFNGCVLPASDANPSKFTQYKSTSALWIWTDLACRCTCFGNMALVSVDRFVATRYPLKYHRIVAQRGGQLMLMYIWFHGAVIASLGLNNWTSSTIPAFAIDNPLGCRKTPDPTYYTFATYIYTYIHTYIHTYINAYRNRTTHCNVHTASLSPTNF